MASKAAESAQRAIGVGLLTYLLLLLGPVGYKLLGHPAYSWWIATTALWAPVAFTVVFVTLGLLHSFLAKGPRGMSRLLLTVGGRALVGNQHPHAGRTVTLLSYGPYGLAILGLVGWRCRAENGDEFYAKSQDLIPFKFYESKR